MIDALAPVLLARWEPPEQLDLWGGSQYTHCSICKRPLTNPVSVARGIGPICSGQGYHLSTKEADLMSNTDILLDAPLDEGIILERAPDGKVKTNVPQLVIHHSPTGFNWGYQGSGPADTALNILEAVLINEEYKGPRAVMFKGDCFELAQALHQQFKREFIAKIPMDEGAIIPYQDVINFIKGAQEEALGNPWYIHINKLK